MSSISIILGKDQSIEKDKVGVDNNKTGDSTIINVFDDNEEEVEELSIISGFEMSDAQMAELISVKNQVNTMCKPTVAVSISVENNRTLREITHDIFMNKDQLVNQKIKETVDDWDELRDKVNNLINDHLKVKFIKQAQKERLYISIQGAKRIITSYNDIGKSYKIDDSVENINRIASITSGQFANEPRYQVNIERDVIRDLNLCYPEKEQKLKGCIARIVTQQKFQMVSI